MSQNSMDGVSPTARVVADFKESEARKASVHSWFAFNKKPQHEFAPHSVVL